MLFPLSILLLIFFSPCILCFTQAPDNVLWTWNPDARCLNASQASPYMMHECFEYFPSDTLFYIDQHWQVIQTIMKEKKQQITSYSDCVLYSIQFYCLTYYRPCVLRDVPEYGQVATRSLVCNDYCPRLFNSCIQQYMDYGLSFEVAKSYLSCHPLYPFEFGHPDVDHFPVDSLTRNYSSILTVWDDSRNYTLNYTDSCYNANYNTLGGISTMSCVQGEAHNEGPYLCALNCPEPLISDIEYDISIIIISILGWISFILCTLLCFLQIIQPSKYLVYPNFSTFFFIVSIMCFEWSFCLTSIIGYKNLWCSSEDHNLWGDFWCTIQGITYSYFLLSSSLWWLSCSIFLLTTILGWKPKEKYIYRELSVSHLLHLVTHCICWGIPLIIVIVALANEKIGYGGSDFWCTIHSGMLITFEREADGASIALSPITETEEVDAWNLALLTIPIYLITLCSTTLLLISLILLCIKTRMKRFSIYWRLILLILLYICIYSFMLASKIEFTAQRSEQNIAFQEYFNCVTKQLESSCTASSKVNFPLWFISSICIASQGIFLFLIYGTSPTLYSSILRYFKLALHGGGKKKKNTHVVSPSKDIIRSALNNMSDITMNTEEFHEFVVYQRDKEKEEEQRKEMLQQIQEEQDSKHPKEEKSDSDSKDDTE